MNVLLCAVPLVPLAVALAVLVCGHRLPDKGGWMTVGGSAVALLLLLALSGAEPQFQRVWLRTAGFSLSVGLQLDSLARFMALLVASVGLLVSVYATGYMADEEGQPRFFAAFSFFLAAMLTLVLANSLLLLFAAWEGVGLASYLLIGFWYTEEAARQAARNAFLLTRFGDLGLLLGWLLIWQLVGTTDLGAFLTEIRTGTIPSDSLTLLALLFFAGAVGKSAQLPLSAWLPEAMAGPTPVSALIHSATMVAAGVYLVLRLFPLFAAAPYALVVVLWIGGITALFAALVATVQTDLKRVLAWSTISQLGEMMLALGVSGPLVALFHLATHATFKSTLFLAAGAIDHGAGSRDLGQLGRLARTMPITALVFGTASLALAGVPPFSGFWSEEAILAQAVSIHTGLGLLMIVLIFLAGVYISRAGMAVLAAWPGSPAPAARDPGVSMTVAMLLLALAALVVGWMLSGQLEAILPFATGEEVGWTWRLLAVLASLSGLAFGAWRVRTCGPVPAFGAFPGGFAYTLHVATRFPAQLACACADGLAQMEKTLDNRVRKLGASIRVLAGVQDLAELRLDKVARTLGEATLALARASEVTERRGFSDRLDRLAGGLSLMGGRLRTLQNGKLYAYTLGIFVWVLATGIVGVLLWR